MKDLAPLQRNYRFSLGKEMCDKYGLKPGDILQMRETPDGILIVPVKVVPKNQPEVITYDKYLNEIKKPPSESSAASNQHKS